MERVCPATPDCHPHLCIERLPACEWSPETKNYPERKGHMYKVCRAQLLIPRVSSNTTCYTVCGSCGCVVCVHECVGTHVRVQVCAPHMWTSDDNVCCLSILGCLHLSFEIRSDIALELCHLDQAPWLTPFQRSPCISSRELGWQSPTTTPGFLFGFWDPELRLPHL